MTGRPRRRAVDALGETVYALTDPEALAAYRRDAGHAHHAARLLRALAIACRIEPVGVA